ncbi:hypothetical protein BT96DRAFT_920212 [Gymnopus androsaceus JB14]|uniref:RRM domain-containing protein n=1 Tax=Gymnopus androsaceus JB14 TaxID=1447944 RepID=A0A6A4HNW1_9AGAR|nr:hypothetical protein BT96DRAFT_920212 [Gymnopus androsaceus JB14]
MFFLRQRVSHICSSLLPTKNVIRPPASISLFAFRQLSTTSRFVYLGNLPYHLENKDIEERAERFGSIKSIDFLNKETAGFANVEFSNPEDAQNFYETALKSGLVFHGQRSRVELVDEVQTRVLPPRKTLKLSVPNNNIFIGNLQSGTTKEEIREIFAPFGTIVHINIAVNRRGSDFAHVVYESIEQASAAMQALNNGTTSIAGRYITLQYAAGKPEPANPPSTTLYLDGYLGDEADLRAALSSYEGKISYVKLMGNHGFIGFSNIDDATAVKVALHQTQTPASHTLRLRFSKPSVHRPPMDIYLIDYAGDEADLRAALSSYTEKILKIWLPKRQIGFIRFKSPDDGNIVKEALDKTQTPAGHTLNLSFSKTPNPPSNTLYFVGYPGNEADLRAALSSYEDKILYIKMVGNQQGFIGFKSIDDATAVKDALHITQTSAGPILNLKFSKPSPNTPSNKLHLVGYAGDEADLRAALSSYNENILDIRLLSRKMGFIKFKSIDDATTAKGALDQTQTPAGHILNLIFSKPPRIHTTGYRKNC